jgi:hypothetical protein
MEFRASGVAVGGLWAYISPIGTARRKRAAASCEERVMSDSFSDRERGFEAKFQLDQQQHFRAEMRRNRLLGEWLADQHFGLTGDDRTAYAKEVVEADLDEPGFEDVVRKVMKDVADKGASLTEDALRAKIRELDSIAAHQIAQEG